MEGLRLGRAVAHLVRDRLQGSAAPGATPVGRPPGLAAFPRSARGRSWAMLLGLAIGAAAGPMGCAGVTRRASLPWISSLPGMSGNRPTAAEVRASLLGWADTFSALVTAASDRIRAETTSREARRHTVLWQLRMIPLARRAVARPNAQEAYVAALATAAAQREYLETGEGRDLFGPHQPVALEAARRIEAAALELGRSFLTPAQIERLRRQVDALVGAHPIRGVFVGDALLQGFVELRTTDAFSWVLQVPMAPFRALRGVSDTAQAVRAFNVTARDFAQTVGDLPHLTRWEFELLLYDTEELESVGRALAAAESLSSGVKRIAGVAETLPERLGDELAARLRDARSTLVELDRALARAQALAGPLDRISERLAEASAQWAPLLAAREETPNAEREAGRPFDVREYEATAERVAEASRELRALVAELDKLDPPVVAELVDRLAWSAAAVIVVFFASLAAYRIVTARWRSPGR